MTEVSSKDPRVNPEHPTWRTMGRKWCHAGTLVSIVDDCGKTAMVDSPGFVAHIDKNELCPVRWFGVTGCEKSVYESQGELFVVVKDARNFPTKLLVGIHVVAKRWVDPDEWYDYVARPPSSSLKQCQDAIVRFIKFGKDGGDTSWHSKDAQPLFYDLMCCQPDSSHLREPVGDDAMGSEANVETHFKQPLSERIYHGEVEVTDGDSVQTMRGQG